jgi:hypothetical protein
MREERVGAEWAARSHGRPSFATRTTDWERGDGRSQRRTHVTSRGSKRDGDASWFQAEKIRVGRKWKEFHWNGGSPVWYHQILASGVSEGMIWKLHWIAFLFPTRIMFHGHTLIYSISEVTHDFGLEKTFGNATIWRYGMCWGFFRTCGRLS